MPSANQTAAQQHSNRLNSPYWGMTCLERRAKYLNRKKPSLYAKTSTPKQREYMGGQKKKGGGECITTKIT